MNAVRIVRNALICDGTGGDLYPGSIRIDGDRIAEVVSNGEISGAKDAEVFDAQGCVVSPGFIDAHSHSDATLLAAPGAFSKRTQGITTEILGNCGHSLFPVTSYNAEQVASDCAAVGVKPSWSDWRDYCEAVDSVHPAVNFAVLCGHNALCAAYPDIEDQCAALDKMLAAGCPGLSSGLLYAPGRTVPPSDLLRLAAVLKPADAVYTTHLRSEGARLIESLEEAVAFASAGSGRLHVSHFKTAGEANWDKLDAALALLEKARERGLRITADRYPYTYSQTSLSVILPPSYDSMRDREIQEKLSADPAECERLIAELAESRRVKRAILTAVSKPEFLPYCGLTLEDCAIRAGMPSAAAFAVTVLRDDGARAMAAFGGMSPDNLRRILAESWVCCGTDENARPQDESLGRGHPRSFGAFPLFLKLTAELVGLPEAVRRVTSFPASLFRLKDRGLIKPGCFADLTVFDPAKLDCKADFAHPHTPAEGIIRVYVNGEPTDRGKRAGRALV
ncbi:MAG: amidohydrolase family protein [Lentisphaeria bacterium]|nr:amidohydrolase family protein [Lentisphaeria bacterium]